jgi:hypothetical protein
MTALSSLAHAVDQELSDDEGLCHRIRVYLQALRLPCLRHIEVAVKNGIAIVEGTVGSYHERQVAVACVKRVAGVRTVTDLIVVLHDRIPSRNIVVGHEGKIWPSYSMFASATPAKQGVQR